MGTHLVLGIGGGDGDSCVSFAYPLPIPGARTQIHNLPLKGKGTAV